MKLSRLILFSAVCFSGLWAFAQASDPNTDLLNDIINVINSFKGGMGGAVKASAIIMLLVASMKVSFIKPLWDKLGAAQVYVAPLLGLLGGLFGFLGPAQFTWASLLAYVMTGGGAVFLHEILDTLKSIPGLGTIYVTIISVIEGVLGGAQKPPSA